MVVAEITGEASSSATDSGHRAAAATLRAHLNQTHALTAGERHLLQELLDRLANDTA